jgi:OOP family OmpA-OmpF porin
MRFIKAVLLALVAVAALQTLTLIFRTERIEADLLRLTRQRIQQSHAGIAIDQVSFEGRDATLVGSVSSEDEKRRVQAVVGAYPVRVVDNRLEVNAPTPMLGAMPGLPPLVPRIPDADVRFLIASYENQQLRLTGGLADDTSRDRILEAVRSAFPGHTVTDETVLDASLGATPWVDDVVAVLPSINPLLHPMLRVSDGAIEIVGNVPTELQRSVVEHDAGAVVGAGRRLVANLRVLESETKRESDVVRRMRESLEAVLAGHKVQFLINTSELVPASKELLDRVAAVLGDAPEVLIEVQGHTDYLGSVAINNALSQSRADAVRNYLISRGIVGGRLTAVGYGPTRPVATNTTTEGRIKNRRVEFSLKGES